MNNHQQKRPSQTSATGITGHKFKIMMLICLNKYMTNLKITAGCKIYLKNYIKYQKRINITSRNGKHNDKILKLSRPDLKKQTNKKTIQTLKD